ncbi:MAG: DUF445 domain-containing protein [Nocardioidaceae bacterium]|nr:DUF445 domain-containing protein [Nocardioidaceae bacterium]
MSAVATVLALDTPADSVRRRGLRRMRTLALGLLLLAALVYVATLDRGGAWDYVHAAAEASMVGAIADWFAVTALFRHPLGLPIPHTALVPTRKNELAHSLRDFFTENFLAESVVRDRVAGAEVSRRVGQWLADEAHSKRVVHEGSRMLQRVLARVADDDISALVTDEMLPRLADEPLSEVAGRLLQEIVAEQAHHGMVDLALAEAHRWLVANPDKVALAIGQRAPDWTPQWLDEVIARRVHTELVTWVEEIRDDERHPARLALDDLLVDLAHDLQVDPATIERAERLKRRLLRTPQVTTAVISLWQAVRRGLLVTLEDPGSLIRVRAEEALAAFGRRLGEDVALQERFDRYASDAAAYVVETYGTEMTTVITETIERWDGDEAARRIELHVGRDLQFIRINGTLVGGLAGLIIYALAQLA